MSQFSSSYGFLIQAEVTRQASDSQYREISENHHKIVIIPSLGCQTLFRVSAAPTKKRDERKAKSFILPTMMDSSFVMVGICILSQKTGRIEKSVSKEKHTMDKQFIKQLQGYGLTTASILYRLPDYQSLLQSYLWQEYDVAPHFPVLTNFLKFWSTNLEGSLHSVTVAHSKLITPRELKLVSAEFKLH